MKKTNKFIMFLAAFMLLATWSFAQVTTSAISGRVVDVSGQGLPGATVVALHTPSGTSFGISTATDGRFNLPNLRVGGPYTVTVSYVGFTTWQQEDLFLDLGATTTINVTLAETGVELQELIVTARAGTVGENTGTSTRINAETLRNSPSADRNLNDFLRLTPQSGAYTNGITFAGANNRYNAIYIDGAVNNDVFGLASSGTNGGQTGISPFSLDIIEQLQVVISPYDVSYGGFAGGGVNAVTRSGTNQFAGTAYTYLRNQSLVGKTNGVLANRLDIEREGVDDFVEMVYGASLGGPIIKDKLFFFTNFEIQSDETPRPFDITEYTSVAGRYQESDLINLRNFLINEYGYDPGTYGSTTNNLDGVKFFGKIDYNISNDHRLTLRHQYTKAEQYSRYSGSRNTVNFSNNGVYFPSTTNSSAIELNSRFGTEFANNFIFSFVRVRDDRGPIGSNFPYVYISDAASGEIRFGSEEFSTANQLDQDIFSITNNFNIYKGAHKITLGTHNEYYNIYNLFIRQNFGTYRFNNLNDFLSGAPARQFDRSYSLVDDITGGGSAAAADFSAMQLGFYAQDDWSVNQQLTLTLGVRVDIPIITSDPAIHETFETTTLPLLQEKYDMAKGIEVGKAPQGQIMLSPRFGFSYDLNGDGSHIFRGGAGIFTSRIPFVWPGGMYTNNGLTVGGVRLTGANAPAFNPDWQNQPVNPDFTVPSGEVNLFVKDFKYPQIFRTNLAYDVMLPFGISATFEALYSKTLNNVLYTNINSNPEVAFNWTGSPDNRPVYVNQNLDNTYNAVYLTSNTNEGYTYNISASFAKNWAFGLSAMLAYSWGDAYSLMDGTSSQNSSQWRGQVNIDGRNNPEFGRSDFAIGHRVISGLTYEFNWTKDANNKTTVSLFMNGQSGSPYHYVISGNPAQNPNRERGSINTNVSLAYIPADASEINLIDYTVGENVITAAQQWENLNRLIEDDKYLSANRGKYAEKNGAWGPFSTIFDIALRQDFGMTFSGQRHRFQLSVDIKNFGNMLNSEWGTIYTIPGSWNNYFLYQMEGYAADGTTPQFTFRSSDVGMDRFGIAGLASRWSMLVGVRYMFN